MINKRILIITLCVISSNKLSSSSEDPGPLIKPFSFTIKGGIAPSIFAKRGSTNVVVSPFDPVFFQVAQGEKFSQMWHNYPLSIGFNVGYAMSSHVELFGEFNYVHAKEKSKPFVGVAPTGAFGTFFTNLDNFQSLGGYLGFRYFFDRIFCNKLSFFLGSKFGMINYKKINANPLKIVNNSGTLSQKATWFESTNGVSGGLQAGFDILFAKSFSLFFNVETVASSAPRASFNIIKEDPAIFPALKNIIRKSPGALISFPVNIGLRFYFG